MTVWELMSETGVSETPETAIASLRRIMAEQEQA
jgi:hypothetical protein